MSMFNFKKHDAGNAIIPQKKKAGEVFLRTDYNCIPRDEVMKTILEMRTRLFEIFRIHIGQENAISPYQLFFEVFNVQPQKVDVFKRNYWYNVLKKVIRELRRTNELFVINTGQSLFVLQTKDEAKRFKKRTNKHISFLERLKQNADVWVREQKWQQLISDDSASRRLLEQRR